jgi:hypothetical protein
MSSPAQNTANQMNAQSSSGPRTDAGKAASAMNGLTHGLSSSFRLLAHEDQAEFDTLAAALKAEMQPTGVHETFLVEQMIQSRWRMARINRLEGAAFDFIMDPTAPPAPNDAPEAKVIAYMAGRKNADLLATLNRYAAAAERLYNKSYRELLHARYMAQKMYDQAMRTYIDKLKTAPVGFGFASQSAAEPPQTTQTAPQPARNTGPGSPRL